MVSQSISNVKITELIFHKVKFNSSTLPRYNHKTLVPSQIQECPSPSRTLLSRRYRYSASLPFISLRLVSSREKEGGRRIHRRNPVGEGGDIGKLFCQRGMAAGPAGTQRMGPPIFQVPIPQAQGYLSNQRSGDVSVTESLGICSFRG